MKVEDDLTITNPIISNNFCNSLLWYSHPQRCTIYESSITTCIMKYSQAATSFSFHLFVQLAPLPPLARNVFHSFLCGFIRICFSLWWFFVKVFDGNPTHIIPGDIVYITLWPSLFHITDYKIC